MSTRDKLPAEKEIEAFAENEFMGHTPAPWYAIEFSGYWNICDSEMYENKDLMNAEDVGTVKAELNAQLAASAPDLLSLTTSQAEQIAQQKELINELVEGLKRSDAALKDLVHQLPVDENLADYRLDFGETVEEETKALIEEAKPFL